MTIWVDHKTEMKRLTEKLKYLNELQETEKSKITPPDEEKQQCEK